jgi:hypothetical protein
LPQAVPQVGLAGRGRDRRALQAGHCAHRLGDLSAPWLWLGQADVGGHGGLVSAAQLVQEQQQLFASELLGRAGQPGDVAGDTAGERAHQNHRDKDHGEARADQ